MIYHTASLHKGVHGLRCAHMHALRQPQMLVTKGKSAKLVVAQYATKSSWTALSTHACAEAAAHAGSNWQNCIACGHVVCMQLVWVGMAVLEAHSRCGCTAPSLTGYAYVPPQPPPALHARPHLQLELTCTLHARPTCSWSSHAPCTHAHPAHIDASRALPPSPPRPHPHTLRIQMPHRLFLPPHPARTRTPCARAP